MEAIGYSFLGEWGVGNYNNRSVFGHCKNGGGRLFSKIGTDNNAIEPRRHFISEILKDSAKAAFHNHHYFPCCAVKTWLWLSMKKRYSMLIDDFPFQPVCCAVKTLLMDAHPVCTRYQFNFVICKSTMHAPQKWSRGHVYDFNLSFPVCGTFSPLLLCHRWGGWISYIVISSRYIPILGSEGAPLSREGQRRRGEVKCQLGWNLATEWRW